MLKNSICLNPSSEHYALDTDYKDNCEDWVKRETVLNLMRYWGEVYTNDEIMEIIESLPPITQTKQDEEDILKFYYVESLDEYWIGQRLDDFYYAEWGGNSFVWTHSRYLPWGEHIVNENTLWKEHTYPSEPKEIPFNEWLQGFLEKEYQTDKTGKWIKRSSVGNWECSLCGIGVIATESKSASYNYCPNCGAKMKGERNDG